MGENNRGGVSLKLSVMVFLTLQHKVQVEGKLGPLHSHSCSVEAEVAPFPGKTIPFAQAESVIKEQILPFDAKVLNDISEFRTCNPTFEAFARHLYNVIASEISKCGGILESITVRESPTRAVKCVRNTVVALVPLPGAYDISQTGSDLSQWVPDTKTGKEIPAPNHTSEDLKERSEPLKDMVPDAEKPVVNEEPESEQEVPLPESTTQEEIQPKKKPVLKAPVVYDKPRVDEKRVKVATPQIKESRADRHQGHWVSVPTASSAYTVLAIILLLVACCLFYRNVLWPLPQQGYPWGSDTWGHIKKAELLLTEIYQGNWLPRFSPTWYSGVEPFRYWAPLPYYILAGLMHILNDPLRAAGIFVAFCAFIGAGGWLLFKKRFGLAKAFAAGLVWLVWLDHVRVAMSEGNLPRVLAIALFPYLLYGFVSVVENKGDKWWPRLFFLAFTGAVLVLSHAMIAATFFMAVTILGMVYALWNGISTKDLFRGITGIVAGIGLSAWWLLPALRSGITSISAEAVSESMQYFPLSVSLNPYLRLSEPEIFYWGLSIVVAGLFICMLYRQHTRLSKAALFVSICLVAVSTPTFRPLYSSIPLHHLMWPLYMASAVPGFLLLGAMDFIEVKEQLWKHYLIKTGVTTLIVVAMLADCFPAQSMINTRTEPTWLKEVEANYPPGGWRQATLDMSGFGSAGTYVLSGSDDRELIYGWAWQGATTATNIVGLNTALQNKDYPYLLDRLVEMGATHVVARRSLIDHDEFIKEAQVRGYTETWRSREALLVTSDLGPYAHVTQYPVLAVGRFAPNWAKMFPLIEVGAFNDIDSYSFDSLVGYEVLILTGAVWKDKAAAESLVSKFAGTGRQVIIDLEGLPEDVLSKRPTFLGVCGEPLLLYKSPVLFENLEDPQQIGTLAPFDDQHYPWKSLSPQGTEAVDMYIYHFDEIAPVSCVKKVGGGEVRFLGVNLPYHAYLTRDPLAVEILEELLGISASQVPDRTIIELSSYQATAQGYSLGMRVPQECSGSQITIPIAYRANMIIEVDGIEVTPGYVHNMITLNLTGGYHEINIIPLYPESMAIGLNVSAFCLFVLIISGLFTLITRKKSLPESRGVPA